MAKSALPVRDLPGGDFLPYDLADLEADGLTKEDVTAFGLAEPRPVSYANGVFMTAGQPKGAMLLTNSLSVLLTCQVFAACANY